VLLWESPELEKQVIPSSALSPPAGFGQPGAQGLKGEYFADTALGSDQLVATRLDPGLELIWTGGPVASVYQDKLDAILAHSYSRLVDDAYLASVGGTERDLLLGYIAPVLGHRMTITQRSRFADKLSQHSNLLEAMSPDMVGQLMEPIYMVPGNEHLDLLVAWSAARPQPRTVIGRIPDRDLGSYWALNIGSYGLIGDHLQGQVNWEDMESLWDEHLERPDGECNLAIAYASVRAAVMARKRKPLVDRINAALADQTITGDQRMTWLLAKAYVKAAMVWPGRPERGIEELEEATLVAESATHRFWALQELVARFASLDQKDRTHALIDQYQDQFAGQAEQAAMAQWRQQADELAAIYAKRREQVDPAPQQAYIKTLKDRLARAQQRGDSEDVARYQRLLQIAESEGSSSP
jgi:hypothetical protein